MITAALLLATFGRHLWSRPGPVVIYLVDTLRPDRMSAYGAERPTTPAAEALAREAVTYTNAFAVSSWTRPSVATMLTSLLPARAAVLNRWGRLDRSVWYLPEAFHRKGWATAAFVANGNVFDDRLGFDRGFDTFQIVINHPTGDWHPTAREVVDPSVKYIESRASSHFFLYVHVVDPHLPYRVEAGNARLFSHDLQPGSKVPDDYDRSVRQADDGFQRIADALRAKGFWQSATVVYLSDHGEEFNEHGGTSHGHTVFEEQLRVPLILKSPGIVGGTRRTEPVSLADIVPTLAERYRLGTSPEWVGNSLSGRLSPMRDLYFTEDLDGNRLYGIRRGLLKLIVRLYPAFERRLYALDRDPGETAGTDLSCGAANAPGLENLDEVLRTWRQRDVVEFPSLLFERNPRQQSCQAVAELAEIGKPFVTAEEYCLWSGRVQAQTLAVRDRPAAPLASLRLAADDRGHPAGVEFVSGEPRCSVSQVASRLLQGQTSEEHLQRLRSLGYLGAP